MNVLFLTKYPVEGASSRYRVYQYIEHLEKSGVTCVVSSFMNYDMYLATFLKGNKLRKVRLTIIAIVKRLLILLEFKKYDVIYMQREMFPFSSALIETVLKKQGVKLVFDYDDALFIRKVNNYNKISNLFRSGNKLIKTFKTVDCVLAGNDYLAEYANKYCSKSLTFEVAEDTIRIKGKPSESFLDNKKIVIGWLGSKTTAKYLNLISKPLKTILERYPHVELEVMGADDDFLISGLEFKATPWSLDNELNALKRFDIGLMPLPEEEWSKGKSGGKARTYMAAGIVPVVTAIGYNCQLIKHGDTGYVVKEQDEWIDALSVLICDREKRKVMSTSARKYVIENFNVETKAKEMKSIFEQLIYEGEKIEK